MKKKILFSDNTLWGLVNFRGPVIQHFIDKGYEVVLVAPEKEDPQLRITIPENVKYIPIDMGRTSRSPINDIKYFFRVLFLYKKERPDYIFHYTIKPNIYGSIAAKLLKIKSTAMMAGMGYVFLNDGIACRIARMLYRFGLKFTDHLFVLNENNRDTVIKRKFCKEEKLILLKSGEGIDLNLFPFHDNRAEKTTFIFIGRILEDKGYYELVEAARRIKAKYPDVNFEILGAFDPQYPKGIPEEVFKKDESDGVFKYLGFTNDMQSVYKRKGLVVVMPSYGEGMNRVLMEACSSGKPIITTRIAGCKEMVDGGRNGFLANPRDAASLFGAMERYIMLTDEEKDNFSHESRRIAEQRFDIKHVIAEYDKLVL